MKFVEALSVTVGTIAVVAGFLWGVHHVLQMGFPFHVNLMIAIGFAFVVFRTHRWLWPAS